MAGWGTFFGTLMEKLPILTPSQRRRINIEKLEKEIKDLEDEPWTPELGARVVSLRATVNRLYRECKDIQ